MANTNAIKARFDDLRIFNSGTLNADGLTYFAGVILPLSNPVRLLKISNNSDQDIVISFRGDAYVVLTNNNPGKIFVPANGGVVYDVASNKCGNGDILELQAGDRFYLRKAQPNAVVATGFIYIEVLYASES